MSQASPVVAALRTAVVVSIVSVLIWVVAEGESLSSDRFEVRVALAPDRAASLVIEPDDAAEWAGRVDVEVDGSTTAVARISDRLRDGLTLTPGTPGIPSDPGTHELDLAEIIRSSAVMESSSVAVRSVEPPTLRVVVEQLQTREIDVAVILPDEAEASAVVADPRRVRLTYPSALSGIVDAGVVATATVTAQQLESLALGDRSTLRDILLALPETLRGERFARVDPATVSVIATLDTKSDEITLDAVPVQIQRPAFQADRWVVRVNPEDQLLQGVTVTGPAALIGQIRSGDVTVFATVLLTPDDLDRRITAKDVGFSNLPTPLQFRSPKQTVRLSIERVEGPS